LFFRLNKLKHTNKQTTNRQTNIYRQWHKSRSRFKKKKENSI